MSECKLGKPINSCNKDGNLGLVTEVKSEVASNPVSKSKQKKTYGSVIGQDLFKSTDIRNRKKPKATAMSKNCWN